MSVEKSRGDWTGDDAMPDAQQNLFFSHAAQLIKETDDQVGSVKIKIQSRSPLRLEVPIDPSTRSSTRVPNTHLLPGCTWQHRGGRFHVRHGQSWAAPGASRGGVRIRTRLLISSPFDVQPDLGPNVTTPQNKFEELESSDNNAITAGVVAILAPLGHGVSRVQLEIQELWLLG